MSVLAPPARPALQPMQHPHDFRLNALPMSDSGYAGQEFHKRPTFRQHVQLARQLPTPSHSAAIPRPPPSSFSTKFSHSENSGDYSVRPEDLLRRKTPAGTVNDAYNGSIAESSDVRGHATKQMLISRPRTLPRENSNFGSGVDGSSRAKQPINPTMNSLPGWFGDQVQVDSMLGLSPDPYGAMDWQYTNQSGPRVMQPPLQSVLGPTASNEHAPYGPYWPNGEFAPYRPTAFTDYTGGLDFPARQSAHAFASTHQSFPHHAQPPSSFSIGFSTGAGTYDKPYPNTTSPYAHTNPGNQLNLDTSSAKLSFAARTRLLAQASRHASQTPAGTSTGSWDASPSNGTPLSASIDPGYAPDPQSSPTGVLSWAYGIYNDLLGTLRHSRRAAEGAFRDLQLRGQAAANTLTRSSDLRHKMSPFPAIPPTASSGGSPYDANARSSPNICAWSDPWGWSPPRDPKKEAYNAVNVLNNLCSQGRRDWIEGMLVNGCLSHLLGEHQNAARWHCRILQLDQNHVEAASNLAASYMALNRRSEAEECFRLAIRLRPTHFEAVEHLIGLLCSDKRNKEAIQIIDHIQAVLHSTAAFDPQHQAFYPNQPCLRYANTARDNGRMMGLIHAKGNLMYNMQDQIGAAKAFEEVVLIAVGYVSGGIDTLIKHILAALSNFGRNGTISCQKQDSLLLLPEEALQTAFLCFSNRGSLPGLELLESSAARRAAISVTSNSLLSLAKIFQDGMNPNTVAGFKSSYGIREILALYYLSLSLQPSPSTANNVGILLASIPSPSGAKSLKPHESFMFPGVAPDSGVALALTYYKYGLKLDSKHAHLYTNLGSLLKDIGQLPMAVQMYEKAVACDGNFDIALANLANAVKDQGRVTDAIIFYRRAVKVNSRFAEAVCGLANALNSICEWPGRGGMMLHKGKFDRFHVDEANELRDALKDTLSSDRQATGWINRVIEITENQLKEGQGWGRGALRDDYIDNLSEQLSSLELRRPQFHTQKNVLDSRQIKRLLESWQGQDWEGALILWLVERFMRMIGWQWYHDRYTTGREQAGTAYHRPRLPESLSTLSAPTVLPFHTFTLPLTAKQVRQISQRNGLRVSCSTLRASWLPATVFPPPAPPAPTLKVGYVSSDFNNHPLAHLMQSVFGMHDKTQFTAYCYATSASDNSVHRQQIERESPHFVDASSWPVERLVTQIVQDGIHILINLNGYTRGARNEIFAARPAPIQMSFMGFAGSLGAEWCDYLLADETAVPPSALRPHRSNVDVVDLALSENTGGSDDWVYPENIVYARNAFFCCDHAQSACGNPTAERQLTWNDELSRRWHMRRELFGDLPDNTIILANFNQLYKIDPTTFRTWLRILAGVPNAILWLLRFPADGALNLQRTAGAWAGTHVASRIRFTDVAPKGQHIARACAADLFLDTSECNAHTTAADCLWSGTPLLTLPRYEWKMCSRMAAGIVEGALDLETAAGRRARDDLIAESEEDYEEKAIRLSNGLSYDFVSPNEPPIAHGRLMELRRMLWKGRWTSKLFDTRRWVKDLELAYNEIWRKWVEGEGGDVWIKDLDGKSRGRDR